MKNKTHIISQTENGIVTIETNVPIEDIREFLDNYCKDNAEKKKESLSVIDYIKEKHPLMYKSGMETGTLDEDFVGAIGVLAETLEETVYEVVDDLVELMNSGFEGLLTASEATVIAMQMYRERCGKK